MTDLTALAEGLTEAQRDCLERADESAGNFWVHFASRSLKPLFRMGLVDYPEPSARLTALGLALRAHLLKGNGDA